MIEGTIDAYLGTRSKPDERWNGALAAAVGLHLTFLGFAFLYRAETPAAGTDRAATEIVWLPADKHVAPAVGPPAVPRPAEPPSLPAQHAALFRAHPRPRLAPAVRRQAPPAGMAAMPAAPAPRPASAPQPLPTPERAANVLWESRLLDRLARLKRYPFAARRDGQQDTVMVRFVIDRGGQVLSSDIIKSQGFVLLDREARALIRRASPLPAPPADVPGSQIAMVAPIQFVLAAAQ
jgi:protein TonB